MLIFGGGIVLGFFLLFYYLLGVDCYLFLFRFEAFVTHTFLFFTILDYCVFIYRLIYIVMISRLNK